MELVLSAIEYLGKDAFKDTKIVSDFATKLKIKNIKDLQNASKGYALWVQDIVQEITNEIH